jgi:hypothetical protein
VLLCIAHGRACGCATSRPGRGVTERTAYGIVTERTEAGYVVKHQDGRRNRSPRPTAGNSAIGEILALLAGADSGTPRVRVHVEVTVGDRLTVAVAG